MADLSITTTAVIPASGYGYFDGKSGEAITIGQVCFLHTDSKLYLCDADETGETNVKGIALNAVAAANQPVRVMTSGTLGLGAILTVAEFYFSSDTPGGIKPTADLDAGDKKSLIGYATTTGNLVLHILNTDVTIPA